MISETNRNYVSSMLVADALLAICHVNAMPAIFTDPATGKTVQSTGAHPLSRLIKAARSWLEWELYRENIRQELAHETPSGVSGNCQDVIAACAVIALRMSLSLYKVRPMRPRINQTRRQPLKPARPIGR